MSAPTTPGPARTAGRFWITVLCFAALNIAAWFGYHAYDQLSRRKDLLTVTASVPDPFPPAKHAR